MSYIFNFPGLSGLSAASGTGVPPPPAPEARGHGHGRWQSSPFWPNPYTFPNPFQPYGFSIPYANYPFQYPIFPHFPPAPGPAPAPDDDFPDDDVFANL